VVFGGSAVWDLASGAAIALTLWAIAVVVIAVAKSWRLSVDHRVIEAAARFEPVDLTTVVKRYVPPQQQTQRAAEEMAIARQVIDARRPRWRRAGIISGVVMLCGVSVAAFSIQRDLNVASTLPVAAKPVVSLNVLKDIQGVWGWRADFKQSCEENPQTISVAPDGKRVSVRYAKPYHHGSRVTTNLDFDVVTTKLDELVLVKSDAATSTQASPVQVHFRFIDANAFAMSWSNDAAASSGTVARCH
jgi:hypothetical protein